MNVEIDIVDGTNLHSQNKNWSRVLKPGTCLTNEKLPGTFVFNTDRPVVRVSSVHLTKHGDASQTCPPQDKES